VTCGHHGWNVREDEEAESEADIDSDPSMRTRIAPDDSDRAGRVRIDPAGSDRDSNLITLSRLGLGRVGRLLERRGDLSQILPGYFWGHT
jgi:hypothetical protein